jgi:hypothetical protein
MAKKQGINAAQMKKNLNQIERLCKQARRVRRATKKYRMGGLSQVEVQENGLLRTYTSKSDIERVCGEENLRRFCESYSRCPFLEEPLLSKFGTSGINANSEAILQGTYQPPEDTPLYIRRYMDALRMPQEVRRRGLIPDRVRSSQNQIYWKEALKSKSSEPGSLHNGHYIAGQPRLSSLNLTLPPTYFISYGIYSHNLVQHHGSCNREGKRQFLGGEDADYSTHVLQV